MLGFMALDFFRRSPLLAYPLVALALFMGVFLLVGLRTLLTRKARYDALAAMPLDLSQEVDRG